MSTPKLIRFSLALLATLSVTGAAWARRPPALVAAQERAESARQACPHHAKTTGYRAMADVATSRPQCVRLRNVAGRLTRACAYHAPSAAKPSAGYRDMGARPTTTAAVVVTRSQGATHSCGC